VHGQQISEVSPRIFRIGAQTRGKEIWRSPVCSSGKAPVWASGKLCPPPP